MWLCPDEMENLDTDTEAHTKRMPWEGKDSRDASKAKEYQRLPGITGIWRRQGTIPLQASEGVQPSPHPIWDT